MKNNNIHSENTTRKHNSFLRIICITAVLTILMTCVTCFSTSAASKASNTKVTQASAKSRSNSKLYCTADDFVALRKSATVNSTELARIPSGKSMTYLNSKSGKWFYVKYGSKKGYVYEDYVSFVNPAGSSSKSGSSKSGSKSNSGSYTPKSNNSYKYYSYDNYSYNNSKSYAKCSRCGGTGTVTCSSCHGSGSLSRTHSTPSYGMGGSSSYSTSSKCYACSGKGICKCTMCGGDGNVL